jgi:hypothetical protein
MAQAHEAREQEVDGGHHLVSLLLRLRLLLAACHGGERQQGECFGHGVRWGDARPIATSQVNDRNQPCCDTDTTHTTHTRHTTAHTTAHNHTQPHTRSVTAAPISLSSSPPLQVRGGEGLAAPRCTTWLSTKLYPSCAERCCTRGATQP